MGKYDFNLALKKMMLEHGITQSEMSKKTNFPSAYVSAVFNCKKAIGAKSFHHFLIKGFDLSEKESEEIF